MRHQHMRHLLIWMVLGMAAAAWAAPQTDLPGGVFLEAENYARIVHGEEGFALVEGQSGASGGRIIQNLGADGLVLYEPRVPKAGSYALWARAATTATATALYGFGADDSQLEKASVAMTAAKASAANAFQWRRLGAVDLPPGPARMLIGRTPARYDCFFLAADAGARVTDAVLHEARRAGEATIGEPLPELRHDRAVTRHPEWLTQRALRPAYGHLEWDPKNTPQSWARMAKESGANCLIGVGEMPAGTWKGKMHIFSFQMIDEPGWSYPKGYQRHDHSWVREFVEAGHAEGLKVVMYDGSWRTLDPLLVEHPEWRQKSVNGAPYRRGFGSWHSPYRQAYIDRWVKVAREHGIDGIMVDMLFTGPAGGDYSPYTVEAFRKRFGVEPPRVRNPRDLAWQRWIDFQTWTREEVMLDVTEALHAVNPEIACIWNQTAGWSFTGQEFLGSRAGRCGDGLLEEMGLELTHPTFEKRPFAWPLQSAWQSLYLRCRAPYGQMYHLNGFYSRSNHQALSLSMFANGIAPAVVTGGNWEHLREVWAHIRACEPHMAGAALEPWAALHFSERTLDRYGGGSDEARRAYLNNVFGLFQALLELHLPVTIVTDDDLEDAVALRRHAVLILGNAACLGDRQAQTIDAYVRAGGGLVATFETGVCDENGARREQPALREILGVRQGDPHKPGVWLLPTSTLEHEALRVPELLGAGDSQQGNRDRMASVAIFNGGRARTAQILQTVPGGDVASVPMFLERDRQGNCKPVGFYALHTRAAGKGRVAFLPPDIGQGYFTYNHPVTRTLLDRVARWAAPTPPVLETGAPMAVQTVCYRKGGSLVVHLVNDNSSYGRGSPPGPENFGAFRDEILPVRDLRVAVRGEFKKATLLPAGKALNVSFREGMSAVVVPEVQVHAMVVFK